MFAVQAWGMLPGAPYRCSLAPACGPRLLALCLGHDRNCAGDHFCWLGQTSTPTSRSWEPGHKPWWPQGMGAGGVLHLPDEIC